MRRIEAMWRLSTACALIAQVWLGYSQTGGGGRLAFEVASIRPSGPHSPRGWVGGPGSSDPGRYVFNSANLADLIGVAYDVQFFQISSKKPLDRYVFDLAANVPHGATKSQFREMMRNLLNERFQLRSHIESRGFPAYALVVAGAGLKMKESTGDVAPPSTESRKSRQDSEFPDLPPDRPGIVVNHSASGGGEIIRVSARRQSVAALARMLGSENGRRLVDATGLKGTYDFTLKFTREYSTAPSADETLVLEAPLLPRALQQQLGLQLVAKTLPFDVVVVESFNNIPTEN